MHSGLLLSIILAYFALLLGIAFYTSGQLFVEEYYALALVGKAGLNTLHM